LYFTIFAKGLFRLREKTARTFAFLLVAGSPQGLPATTGAGFVSRCLLTRKRRNNSFFDRIFLSLQTGF
jgi:hypothetical protein